MAKCVGALSLAAALICASFSALAIRQDVAGASAHMLGQPATREGSAERLKALDRKGLTAAQRTGAGLDQLRSEMKTPTPFNEKDRTRPSGHDWEMSRIVARMAAGALDLKTLREELKQANPGEFQTSLRILLARKGEKGQVPALAQFLAEDRRFAWLREQALTALERFKDRDTVEVVWKVATQDPYYLLAPKVADPKGREKPGEGAVYPVRRRALQVLKKWRNGGMPMNSYVQRAIQANRYQFRFPDRPKKSAPRS